MLPNHAPLVIAEQFGTLESLYPGRIDLGLGRAPGHRPGHRARAAPRPRRRRGRASRSDVLELHALLRATRAGPARSAPCPGAGLDVPIWILGSSLFGAQLAAALGLPFAFASHFAPAELMQAIELYRERLPAVGAARPAVRDARASTCSRPTPTTRRGGLLTSAQQAFVQPAHAASPARCRRRSTAIDATAVAGRARDARPRSLSCSAVGSPETVRARARGLRRAHRRRRADGRPRRSTTTPRACARSRSPRRWVERSGGLQG